MVRCFRSQVACTRIRLYYQSVIFDLLKVGFSLIIMVLDANPYLGRSSEGQVQSWHRRMMYPLPRMTPFVKGFIGCAEHCSVLIDYE